MRIFHRRTRRRGQALVEFALAIPIFLLLVFGLIDIGRLVYINNAISQGAREGARFGSVQGRAATVAGRDSVVDHTTGIMAAVPAPTVSVSCERDGSVVTSCRTNDLLVVEVQSSVAMFTPVIGQLVGTVDVSATAKVMVNQ